MKNFRSSAFLCVQPAVVARPAAAATSPGKAAAGAVRRYVHKAAFVLLTLGGSFLASPVVAQEAQPVTVQKVNDTTFRVRIQNPTQQAGRVRVTSLVTGQTLLDDRYNAPAYGRALDFRDLSDGQYLIVLHVGASKYRYTVQVHNRPQFSVALRMRTMKTRLPELSAAAASL